MLFGIARKSGRRKMDYAFYARSNTARINQRRHQKIYLPPWTRPSTSRNEPNPMCKRLRIGQIESSGTFLNASATKARYFDVVHRSASQWSCKSTIEIWFVERIPVCDIFGIFHEERAVFSAPIVDRHRGCCAKPKMPLYTIHSHLDSSSE